MIKSNLFNLQLYKHLASAALIALLISFNAGAQTTFWSDNFDSPSGGANNNNAGAGWNFINTPGGGSNTQVFGISNFWTIGSSGSCVTGNSLYISNDLTDDNTYFSNNNNDLLATSPNISTVGVTGITLKFTWHDNGAGSNNLDYGSVGLSSDGGATWTYLPTHYINSSSCQSASVTIPNTYEGITKFEIGFRWMSSGSACASCDPPFDIDNILLVGTVAGCTPPTVNAGSPATICNGSNANLGGNPTATGTPGPYTYAWSPATVNSTTVSNPVATPTATTTYTVVVTDNTTSCSASNTVVVTVTSPVTASVNISANPGDTICAGTSVTFTATPQGGGSTPTYQWKLNGNNVGTNSVTYTNGSLSDGDVVTCIMTSSLTSCVSGSPATSNIITITVGQAANAGVISSPKNPICQNTVAHLTVMGATGTIQWQSSPDSTTSYTNISGAKGTTIATNPISQTTYFRVAVGTGTCTAYSGVYKLSVIPAPVASFTAAVNGHTVIFNADSSSGATSYFWDFGDGKTASVKDTNHTFHTDSTYHVCLTVKNNSNCNFTLCKNVITFPEGVNNINSNDIWQIYPDPFGSTLYIGRGNNAAVINDIQMYDVLGRKIYFKEIAGSTENPVKLDLPNLKAGVYFLKIETKNGDFIKKVVKQ